MGKYIGSTGLSYLWGKIKDIFATKTEVSTRTTARIYYGTCSTTASSVAKEATAETFPTVAYDDNGTTKYKPESGTVVGIKYSVTNTYKTAGSTHTLKVNDTGAWPMYYNNAELATTTSANTLVAGYKNRYVFYMFNGSQWVFITASYDANSTYSAMTLAEIEAGTGTTGRTMTPKILRENFYTEDEVDDALALKANTADLATVATSGSYNDLSNKPTIPTVPVISTSIADDATSNTKTASPKAVKEFVENKGYTDNAGTITGIKMNGSTVASSGVADLGTVITSHQDISGKQDAISAVTVSVDANTGTPSGTVSFSNNTLAFSFQNIKGAKGDTGAQGIQGPQGPQGPKGDTGVTGDASSLAVIHGVDKTTTYATTDVAGADALQSVLIELDGGYLA